LIRCVALIALLAACDIAVGDPGAWIPIAELDGPLRPELVQPPSAAEPGNRLRVVTFNVALGENVEALAEALTTHPDLAGADVVLLQEIESHPAEDQSRAARLAAALGMGHAYAPAREVDGGTHGLAILSRFRLSDVEVMALPRVELTIRPRHRIALAARIAGVRIVNVHLDTRINITDRILQLRPAILDEPAPVLVGGDFNTNPYAWTAGALPDLPGEAVTGTDQADLLDDYMRSAGYDTPTAALGPTQDALVMRLRLDAIFTRGLIPIDAGVVPDLELSDHLPLWLDVPLPTAPRP
jgi:endonuclease/exonuclease/phosphatase family metal-dependent hydrolase